MESDPEMALWLGCLPALAFVPLQHVDETHQILQDSLPDSLDRMDEYWVRNYMGALVGRRGRRREPRSHGRSGISGSV